MGQLARPLCLLLSLLAGVQVGRLHLGIIAVVLPGRNKEYHVGGCVIFCASSLPGLLGLCLAQDSEGKLCPCVPWGYITCSAQALGPASAALISLYYKGLFPRPSSPCPVNSHRAKGQTQFTVLSLEVGGGCSGKKGSWTESEASMTLAPSPQFHICPFICRCRSPDLPMNPNSRDS